jgi:murein DD-endopeptidase MepM/ murein hydrolase activator NlpD
MARRLALPTTLLLLLLAGVVPWWPTTRPATPTGHAGAAPAAPAAGPGYRLPLSGSPTVTRPFQLPPQPWMAGHRGVDLAATPGATVFAAGTGVVAFAGDVAGVGVVSVDHPDGLRTTYLPVRPLVRAGDRVATGDPIGTVLPGHPGCPVAACLHWGLRHGTEYLDPLSLLRPTQVRLYPARG